MSTIVSQHSLSRWSNHELEEFRDRGYRIVRGLFSSDEIEAAQSEIPELLIGNDHEDQLHRERERSGAVRQVYLAHCHSPNFRALACHAKIVEPVKQLLGSDVYIWHSKINVKEAFEGTVWLWHQDYGYWVLDGVEPQLISVMILLDSATINNGSLMVVAGSHRWGRLGHYSDTVTTSYKQWCIEIDALRQRLREDMIEHVTGEPGDVLFFDCNLVHGSGHNMSPLPRNTYIVVYNDIQNKPRSVENPRPNWVVARSFETITPGR